MRSKICWYINKIEICDKKQQICYKISQLLQQVVSKIPMIYMRILIHFLGVKIDKFEHIGI